MDPSTLCRGCMKEVASWDIHTFDQRIADMFTFCTQIMILHEEKLPKHFCLECLVQIESSYTYIKKAQEVDSTLKNLVSRTLNSVIIKPNAQSKHLVDESDIPSYSNVEKNIDHCATSNDSFHLPNDIETGEESTVNLKSTNLKNNDHAYQENDKLDSGQEIEEELNVSKCNVCDKIFVNGKWLAKHMKTVHYVGVRIKNVVPKINVQLHEPGKGYMCTKCLKTFSSETWYTKHMETAHAPNKRYYCPHCPKASTTYDKHRYHLNQHPEHRVHPCESCGKRFAKRKHLAAHLVCHDYARPFPCHVCDKTFKLKSVLTSHLKTHEAERSHLCHICGANFRVADILNVHMRSHTGEKPFACPLCPYRSGHSTVLARHIRSQHTQQRQHTCPLCKKQFHEKGDLTRHYFVHTGERPFKCPSCSRGFTSGWKRKMHLMHAHLLSLNEIPRMNRDGIPIRK